MFLWRWFKKLVFLGVLAVGAYIGSGYVQFEGKPLREQIQQFMASDIYKEGMKDMRMWVAAALQLASKKVEEGVTPADQQKLDSIIKADLKTQIESLKNSDALKSLPADASKPK